METVVLQDEVEPREPLDVLDGPSSLVRVSTHRDRNLTTLYIRVCTCVCPCVYVCGISFSVSYERYLRKGSGKIQ